MVFSAGKTRRQFLKRREAVRRIPLPSFIAIGVAVVLLTILGHDIWFPSSTYRSSGQSKISSRKTRGRSAVEGGDMFATEAVPKVKRTDVVDDEQKSQERNTESGDDVEITLEGEDDGKEANYSADSESKDGNSAGETDLSLKAVDKAAEDRESKTELSNQSESTENEKEEKEVNFDAENSGSKAESKDEGSGAVQTGETDEINDNVDEQGKQHDVSLMEENTGEKSNENTEEALTKQDDSAAVIEGKLEADSDPSDGTAKETSARNETLSGAVDEEEPQKTNEQQTDGAAEKQESVTDEAVDLGSEKEVEGNAEDITDPDAAAGSEEKGVAEIRSDSEEGEKSQEEIEAANESDKQEDTSVEDSAGDSASKGAANGSETESQTGAKKVETEEDIEEKEKVHEEEAHGVELKLGDRTTIENVQTSTEEGERQSAVADKGLKTEDVGNIEQKQLLDVASEAKYTTKATEKSGSSAEEGEEEGSRVAEETQAGKTLEAAQENSNDKPEETSVLDSVFSSDKGQDLGVEGAKVGGEEVKTEEVSDSVLASGAEKTERVLVEPKDHKEKISLESFEDLLGDPKEAKEEVKQETEPADPPPKISTKKPKKKRKKEKTAACSIDFIKVVKGLEGPPFSPKFASFNTTYVDTEPPNSSDPHWSPRFGGHQTWQQRESSFLAQDSTVHCGFVKPPPGHPNASTGFDIDPEDAEFLRSCSLVVSSAIFGDWDHLRAPLKRIISTWTKKTVCFVMFLDRKSYQGLADDGYVPDGDNKVGLWRLVVVRNLPYSDNRKTGKVPKLILHRLFPNARYSIWVDSKLRLMADPLMVWEKYLWRDGFEYAISQHYDRSCVWKEVDRNKELNKYNHSVIDQQFEVYKRDGLTKFDPNDPARLLPSNVPEGSFIVRAHTPMANLFSCVWFNEVDRFTSRDQLSFFYAFQKLHRLNSRPLRLNMMRDCERRSMLKLFKHKSEEGIVARDTRRPEDIERDRIRSEEEITKIASEATQYND